MRDPRHDEFERLQKRALEIGNTGTGADYRELLKLLESEFPVVRKAAASALCKWFNRDASVALVCKGALFVAIGKEEGEQTLNYMIKALAKCGKYLNRLDLDLLRDIARNPTHKDYVRASASEAIAVGERENKDEAARLRHWCTRCRRPISAEESAKGIDKYGKPYCRHCLEERRLEDINFEANVEAAKRLRTIDEVAVQSRGEKMIGDWLAANRIAYQYDERMILAGDIRIRPDFYLPEFDIYIEYWGMNTREYLANRRNKQILYQRDHKRLISLTPKDLPDLDAVLKTKLSRYLNVGLPGGPGNQPTVGDSVHFGAEGNSCGLHSGFAVDRP